MRILDASNYYHPRNRSVEAIYDQRFSIEHSIRFLKGELVATFGEFNGQAAKG
ncbi:MAG: hypothetical protein AB7P14_28720 [Blastocatellales bacterium]